MKFQSKIIDSTKFKLKSTYGSTQDECGCAAYVKKDAIVNDVFEAYDEKKHNRSTTKRKEYVQKICVRRKKRKTVW